MKYDLPSEVWEREVKRRKQLEACQILLDYVTGEMIPDVKQQGVLIAALDEIKYQLTQ